MFTRLLVPTDFSPPSDAALAYARTLAGAFGARLHVLHVIDNVFLRAGVTDLRNAIKIADIGNRNAKAVIIIQGSSKTSCGVRDLLF